VRYWKQAFSIYKEKIAVIFSLGFLVFIIGVFQLLSIEVHSSLLFMSSVLSGVVVSYIVYIAMILAIASSENKTFGAPLEETQPKVLPAVWVSALMVLAVSGGVLLLFVPGILVLGFFIFSLMANVVDGYKKHEALFQSWLLVRGRWLQVFWQFIIANLLIGLIGAGVYFFFWLFGVAENDFQKSLVNQAISNFFVVPMSVAYTFAFYKGLKSSAMPAPSETERQKFMSRLHVLVGVGAAFIVFGIFILGFFMVHFLPDVVGFTHAPAAAFEAL